MFFFRKKRPLEPEPLPEIISFDSSNFEALINYVEVYSGVDLEPKKDILKQRFASFCEQREIYSFNKLLENIKHDKNLRQNFVNLLTVNETYFLREKIQLNAAIAFLKNIGRGGRVLSAPCASGEEVYSLFILALEAGVSPFSFEITGIDINSEAIKKAKKGIFSERSLHRMEPALRLKYFQKEDSKYRIKDSLFGKTEFLVRNVFDEDFLRFEPFDLIFSRNMMIYFDQKYKYKIIERFHQLLKPKGRLYAGHADLVPNSTLFNKVTEGKLTFYEKI